MYTADDFELTIPKHSDGRYIFVGDGEVIPAGYAPTPGLKSVYIDARRKDDGQRFRLWMAVPETFDSQSSEHLDGYLLTALRRAFDFSELV